MRILRIILTACLLLCFACTRSSSLQPFLLDDTVRLEIDGNEVFTYDEPFCQLSYNEQRMEFRAMTDTMLDYFCIKLGAIPTRVGERVTASVVWSTPSGERTRNDITLEARSIKGDVIWLADSRLHTAAVVRVLK